MLLLCVFSAKEKTMCSVLIYTDIQTVDSQVAAKVYNTKSLRENDDIFYNLWAVKTCLIKVTEAAGGESSRIRVLGHLSQKFPRLNLLTPPP